MAARAERESVVTARSRAPVKLRRRKAGPVAVDSAAADTSAHDPDDVAVAVIGSVVAVLVNRAPKLGEYDNNGVIPLPAEPFGERREPFAQRPQMVGEF